MKVRAIGSFFGHANGDVFECANEAEFKALQARASIEGKSVEKVKSKKKKSKKSKE